MSYYNSEVEVAQHLAATPPPLGINVEKPKYPQYAVYAKRLESFQNWPKYLPIDKKNLVDAGLVNTGVGDCIRCYFCGAGLRNWEYGDVPMEEYAKWYPTCTHILLVKVQAFVEKIRRGEKTDVYDATNKRQDTVDAVNYTEMLAAKTCIAMGYSEQSVEKAINIFIQKYGKKPLKGTDICEIVDDIESNPGDFDDVRVLSEETKHESCKKDTKPVTEDEQTDSSYLDRFRLRRFLRKNRNSARKKDKQLFNNKQGWAMKIINSLMNVINGTLETATEVMSMLFQKCPELFPNLNRTPTQKDLVSFAQAIGENFRYFGLALGVSDVSLDQISMDNPTVVMKTFEMLKKWCKENPLESSLSTLIQTLKTCSCVRVDWGQIGKLCM